MELQAVPASGVATTSSGYIGGLPGVAEHAHVSGRACSWRSCWQSWSGGVCLLGRMRSARRKARAIIDNLPKMITNKSDSNSVPANGVKAIVTFKNTAISRVFIEQGRQICL